MRAKVLNIHHSAPAPPRPAPPQLALGANIEIRLKRWGKYKMAACLDCGLWVDSSLQNEFHLNKVSRKTLSATVGRKCSDQGENKSTFCMWIALSNKLS